MDKLSICYASSNDYCEYTGISILSLLMNTPKEYLEKLFILDYGIQAENKEKLMSLSKKYAIDFVFIDAKPILENLKEKLGIQDFRSSLATYSRAFIDYIIPEDVDRLLYIDSDTIVNRSVQELCSLNMENCVIAGAIALDQYDGMHTTCEFPLLSGNRKYIGCGIVFYELHQWRKLRCTEMIQRICKENISLKFADQSLINNAIPEKYIKILPITYNYAAHGMTKASEMKNLRAGNWYTEEECIEAKNNPTIIHYKGDALIRPWYDKCVSRRTGDYRYYKSVSPWKDTPLSKEEIFLEKLTKRQKLQYEFQRKKMLARNAFEEKLIGIPQRVALLFVKEF